MTTVVLRHACVDSIEIRVGVGEYDEIVESIGGGVGRPAFPFPDGSVDAIEAIDVLEHVADEEAWLAECGRVLRPGGTIQVQVPRRGVTSWFESLNIYRYTVDVLGRGHDPEETKLIGWHRQYRDADLRAMFSRAGFSVVAARSHSIGLGEVSTLVRLVIGDLVRNDRSAGRRACEERRSIDAVDSHIPAGPFSRRILMTAVRAG
jgi:SAM-dependent methyltransferase